MGEQRILAALQNNDLEIIRLRITTRALCSLQRKCHFDENLNKIGVVSYRNVVNVIFSFQCSMAQRDNINPVKLDMRGPRVPFIYLYWTQ